MVQHPAFPESVDKPDEAYLTTSGMYVWATGIGAICIIVLQSVASIAVFGYFRKNRTDTRPWQTLIAPGLSVLALTSLAILALSNFSLLVGEPGALAVAALAALPVLAALIGCLRAVWLRSHRPEDYSRIGQASDI